MDQFEYDEMVKAILTLEQDAALVKIEIPESLKNFRPRVKTSVPSESEMLMEEITGSTTKDFNAEVQKSQADTRNLDIVDTLSRATDFQGLEAAASVNGSTIQKEMNRILRKGVQEIPGAVGVVPQGPRRDTTNTSKPNAARRAKLKQMCIASGVVSPYSNAAIESLLDAMEAYMDNQVS
jgi:hypothetical protein